jgi:hypothetical protein
MVRFWETPQCDYLIGHPILIGVEDLRYVHARPAVPKQIRVYVVAQQIEMVTTAHQVVQGRRLVFSSPFKLSPARGSRGKVECVPLASCLLAYRRPKHRT